MARRRQHWHGQASVYDDGTLLPPAVYPCADQPARHLDLELLDRTAYRQPFYRAGRWIAGEFAVQFWGYDRDRVLAATRERFEAELGAD